MTTTMSLRSPPRRLEQRYGNILVLPSRLNRRGGTASVKPAGMSRLARSSTQITTPDPARTVSAGLAQMWLMFGVLHGLDSDDVCGASGFRAADIADREGQIPRAWYVALRRAVIDGLPHLAVGIEVAALASVEQLGYLGLAIQRCATPLETLELVIRFGRTVDSAAPLYPRIESVQEHVHWVVPRSSDDPPEAIEAIFIGNVSVLRRLTGTNLRPHRVDFSARREALRGRLEGIFAAPIVFGAPDDRMVFERADLERPILGANADAVKHCEAQLHKVLGRVEEPLVTVVSRAIEVGLEKGDVGLAKTARRIGLSARYLQRKLKEHGVNYHGLVDEIRRAVAMRLLADRSATVYEAAFAAGYEDVSSFNRAFRRWTGSSPRAFRSRSSEQASGGSAVDGGAREPSMRSRVGS